MAIRKVQVWNDDHRDYTEVFRGESLTIPAKQYIVMEDPDASQFMGRMIPLARDGQGNQKRVKALRKVYITEAVEEQQKNQCMLCKKEFKSLVELQSHSTEHADVMVDEKAKEDVTKKSKFFSKK